MYIIHFFSDGWTALEERMRILVTANMTGTNQKKLLVIGSPKDPRSCKGIKLQKQYIPSNLYVGVSMGENFTKNDYKLFW